MLHVKLRDTSGAPLHWQKGYISGPINVTLTNNTSYESLIFFISDFSTCIFLNMDIALKGPVSRF